MSFEDNLSFGEEGEKCVAIKLIEAGVSIAPLYQFHNHDCAPFLLTSDCNIVLPDLTCWQNGKTWFVECKRKKQWVHFNGKQETGLNYNHYKAYERVQEVTGIAVNLVFIHEGEDAGMYCATLNKLKTGLRYWDGMAGGKRIGKPLALFDAALLRKVA